ncbi:DNA-directed RNA polymerase II subunit RPB1 [Apostasia shenzhenica]|uniref:DNA-directed RNA polymerase subunit n=1 Tax=Apostasia shenzhenica TaxID=1088818 RepID=A0A2I0B600_9ASPA|nr:DNA-directed RNA polymerase II subunit RPB1 [Apostasia shenzhenica]
MKNSEEKLRCTKDPYIEDDSHQRIESIRFSVHSGEDIRKQAEVQVWKNSIYDVAVKPTPDGLLDLRMGPPNKSFHCATCHGDFTECPGHFGFLKLTLPVFNVGYFNSILNILKCICKACARVLLPENERRDFLKDFRKPRADATQRDILLKKVRNRCSTYCVHCGYKNGAVKKLGSSLIIVEDFAKKVDGSADEFRSALSQMKDNRGSHQAIHVLRPLKVLSLFKRMLDMDCELLNLNDRPEKLVITDIAVPPSTIRPSSPKDAGMSNENDATTILKSIVNTNSILREDLEGAVPLYKCLECWDLLQVQVAEYINSEAPCVPDNKNRGLIQRLKGKQGRFRCNLSGKRVDFTGRTVISPDPNLKITEVAIPILMAQALTYPERVSCHNIDKLRQCVRNGRYKYPGANFLMTGESTMDLKYGSRKRLANELKYGDTVHRHLIDGDLVLFNRQPSLHRMSLMCHRARIMPWRTLRFNESVCNPYNADFDGDEMNLHVPQTEEARTEALMLMGVESNLCTPKNGEILVASTQDFLTSSFMITRKDTFYDRATFSLMCSYMGDGMESIDLPTPALLKPVELWTGKQLFNVLVRPNASTRVFINLTVKEKSFSKPQNVSETMCPRDGFVYLRNSELISGQLGKATLGNGNKDGLFAVLLRDYNEYAAASCMSRLAKLSSRWIGNHGFSIGIDDVQPGEQLIQQKKRTIDDGNRDCREFISKYNKGELTPQTGCDAAQTLELEIYNVLNKIRSAAGNVCMDELHWRNSPLIMSQCGSKGSPINISQMIALVGQQSVGGRRAPNGFIDRTLPHFPINSKTPSAKGFVANSFYTGLTATEFFFHTMAGREGLVDTAVWGAIYKVHKFDANLVKTAETGYMSRRLIKGMEDVSLHYDLTVRDASGGIVQLLYGDDGLDPAKMEGKEGSPLNFDQLFIKVMAICPHRDNKVLSPGEIMKTVNRLLHCERARGCSSEFIQNMTDFIHKRIGALSKTINAFQLDDHLMNDDCNKTESVATYMSGISSKQLEVFLDTCISRYHLKKLEAGAAIGVIGAQSIGEPGTQMTLKTFHFAGVANMNVTLGVPRILEIINASKNIRTPVIKTQLLSNKEPLSARIVKGCIEKTALGEVSKSIKIVLKAAGQPYISIVLDKERIEDLNMRISSETVQYSILNHPKMGLKPEHVRSLDSEKLRIYPPNKDKSRLELHTLKTMLPKVIVKGIPTVKRAVIKNDRGLYSLWVEGTNYLAVMGTPGVDASKTTSNNVIEVRQTLGIEAARQTIINEIKFTMEGHGISIDTRHMKLLADLMTYRGEVLGMTRFGLTKMKSSVLMLASFEKTSEHLFNASYSGREDRIDGVSECIIMGIPIQLGSGMLKVRQRVNNLPALKYAPDPLLG